MEIFILLVWLAAIAFYFLPTVIAVTRRVEHDGAIMVINLLFGWTILGWIAALIWAAAEKTKTVALVTRQPTSAEIKARLAQKPIELTDEAKR